MSKSANLTAIAANATLGIGPGALPIAPTLDYAGGVPISTGAALPNLINGVNGSAGGTVTMPDPVDNLRVGLLDIIPGATWTIATAGPDTVQSPDTGAIGATASVPLTFGLRVIVYRYSALSSAWLVERLVTFGTIPAPTPPGPDTARFATRDDDLTSGGGSSYVSIGASLWDHPTVPATDPSIVHVRAGVSIVFGDSGFIPITQYAATLDEIFSFGTGSTTVPFRSDTNANTATSGNEGHVRLEVISGSLFLRVNDGGTSSRPYKVRSTLMVTPLAGPPSA